MVLLQQYQLYWIYFLGIHQLLTNVRVLHLSMFKSPSFSCVNNKISKHTNKNFTCNHQQSQILHATAHTLLITVHLLPFSDFPWITSHMCAVWHATQNAHFVWHIIIEESCTFIAFFFDVLYFHSQMDHLAY